MSLLLPEGARLLHIGPQKTGTTSLQAAMHARRLELAEHGVVYAGRGTRPRGPIWALVGMPDGSPAPPRAQWERFCAEVAAAGDRRVCISTEGLGRVDLGLAREAVAGLGGNRVHVVAAARALDSLLPSQWQQRVRMRRTSLSFDDWLRVVLEDRSHPEAVNVWMPHDVGGLVDRWVQATGSPDRFTLLVSDRSRPDLTPRAFEKMLGLPPGLLELDEGGTRNASLGIGRTELIRLVNATVDREGWDLSPTHPLRVQLTNAIKREAPWPDEAPLPGIPDWAKASLAQLGEERAAAVRQAGVRVVGDPDALRAAWGPDDDPVPKPGPTMVTAELAAAALQHVLAYAMEQEAAARIAQQRVRRLRRQLRPSVPGGGSRGTVARLRSWAGRARRARRN